MYLTFCKSVINEKNVRYTKLVISGLFTWCCYPCAVCMLGSRTGECFCTPACVPASDITLRTRIRTLGGIQVGLFIVSITLLFICFVQRFIYLAKIMTKSRLLVISFLFTRIETKFLKTH